MSFLVIKDGKTVHRRLEGRRTLSEILTSDENQLFEAGTLAAFTENGGLMSPDSPLDEGQTVVLRAPRPEDFVGFRMPGEKVT
jgi:hypothetical protein